MTSYSAPSIHRCPGCSAFYKQARLRSVNFYGTRDWSDGVPTAFWRQEPLVRCDACAALFWREDIEMVGIMPDPPARLGRWTRAWLRWRGDPDGRVQAWDASMQVVQAWRPAYHIGSVNFDDVVYVLSRSRGVSVDRILWLRNRIWWGLNDRYRLRVDGMSYVNVPHWPASAERANMETILDILQDGEASAASLIQQGEMLRLLGRFDQAIAVLRTVPTDGHAEFRAAKIAALARSGDTGVQELSPPRW